jgi:probable phosphoglycerate mutase
LSTRVIIVRHGQSSYNSQGRIQGRSDDSILTEKGKTDAAQVADILKNIPIDAAYCSPLQRAKSTAEIIVSGLDSAVTLQPDKQLMEIDLPLWENLFKEDVKANFPQEYRFWKDKPHELRMQIPTDDGVKEHYPVLALYEQAKGFWQKLLKEHQGDTVLIVAHNGINRALIATAMGMSPSRYHAIQQSNCGITVLNFAGSRGEAVQLESLNLTSHVGENLPKVRPGHQGARLLLVRHGETEWNRAGRFQGQIDVPLNENGKNQSQKARDFLDDTPLDLAFTSPMLRPKETAEIILEAHSQVNLVTHSGLSEIAHGLWEGKLEAEIDASYPGELQRWRTIPEQVQMPEGENLQQVWDRAIPAWQAIVEEVGASEIPRTALVVAHDATNKVILCHILGLEPADFWKIKQGNCAVTVIDYPEGAQGMPVLQSLNITTHLGGGVIDKTAAGAL